MRVRHADHLALVLERQHVPDLGPGAELEVLIAPRPEQVGDCGNRQLRERRVVLRRIADDAGHAGGRLVPIDARWPLKRSGRIGPDAGMVVVEDEDRLVIRVPRAADADVPRTEIAAVDVVGRR
jgi:hypothetical protein